MPSGARQSALRPVLHAPLAPCFSRLVQTVADTFMFAANDTLSSKQSVNNHGLQIPVLSHTTFKMLTVMFRKHRFNTAAWTKCSTHFRYSMMHCSPTIEFNCLLSCIVKVMSTTLRKQSVQSGRNIEVALQSRTRSTPLDLVRILMECAGKFFGGGCRLESTTPHFIEGAHTNCTVPGLVLPALR